MTHESRRPLVSVVITAYQQSQWIPAALDSVLGQTYPLTEIIMVDDGSTDGTSAMVRELYGTTVRVLRQSNRGLPAARNTGLTASTGAFLQFLDGDDLLAPEKIAAQVNALERSLEHDLAYCDFDYFRSSPACDAWPGDIPSPRRSGSLFPELLKGNFIVSHAALIRRSALLEAGGFDERLGACEDYDLWLRLAAAGRLFLYTPGSMAHYRRRSGSMSSEDVGQVTWTLRVLEGVLEYAGSTEEFPWDAYRGSLQRYRDFLVFSLLRRSVRHLRELRLASAASAGLRALLTDPLGAPRRAYRLIRMAFDESES